MCSLRQVWGWIVKILLQELVGHQVWWYDPAASTDTFYTRLVLNAPERRTDLDIQNGFQAAAPTEHHRAITQQGETVWEGGASTALSAAHNPG